MSPFRNGLADDVHAPTCLSQDEGVGQTGEGGTEEGEGRGKERDTYNGKEYVLNVRGGRDMEISPIHAGGEGLAAYASRQTERMSNVDVSLTGYR
jgi:hypothetical protein